MLSARNAVCTLGQEQWFYLWTVTELKTQGKQLNIQLKHIYWSWNICLKNISAHTVPINAILYIDVLF